MKKRDFIADFGAKEARGRHKTARGRAQLLEFGEFARGKCLDSRRLTYGHRCALENSRLDRKGQARPWDADGRAQRTYRTCRKGGDCCFAGAFGVRFSIADLRFHNHDNDHGIHHIEDPAKAKCQTQRQARKSGTGTSKAARNCGFRIADWGLNDNGERENRGQARLRPQGTALEVSPHFRAPHPSRLRLIGPE